MLSDKTTLNYVTARLDTEEYCEQIELQLSLAGYPFKAGNPSCGGNIWMGYSSARQPGEDSSTKCDAMFLIL